MKMLTTIVGTVIVVLNVVQATGGISSCVDNDTDTKCTSWKKRGRCKPRSFYHFYMRHHCAKTCDLCEKSETIPTFPEPFQCGRTNIQQSRVVNGEDAKEGSWPWLGALQNKGNHFCGTTLITPTWVLTASHCVSSILEDEQDWEVKMGAHVHWKIEPSVQYRTVKRVIMHPQYDPIKIFADHALIEVDKPFKLNARVNIACLPKDGEILPVGTQDCYIAGWGSIKHPGNPFHLLQQARMPVVPSTNCKHQLETICVGYGDVTKPNACRGDSGGPLMCRNVDQTWTVHGAASYVVEYCKYYTAYSPVHKYLPWIKKYVSGISQH